MRMFCLQASLIFLLVPLNISRASLLELVHVTEPTCVFFGPGRAISLTLRNTGEQEYAGAIRARIFQTTSSTAVSLGESAPRTLRVLSGQTVLETTAVDFPAVRAETKFLLQWLEGSNHVLGTTEVWVYPTNLLTELGRLAKQEPIGVFDPLNQLKPLLRSASAEVTDLENGEIEQFSGKLAIFGPFGSPEPAPDQFAERIRAMWKRDIAVVWVRPPAPKPASLQPSFYSVPEKQAAVVVVQPMLVSDLPSNPLAQLNLIELCKLALHPRPPELPGLPR